MKKIYSLVLVLCAISIGFSQQVTLENNDGDNLVTGTNSVGCPSGDNNWARNFVLADFGVTGDFTIESVDFGIQSIDAETAAVITVYSSSATFDEASLALLGSQPVTVAGDAAAPGSVSYTLTTPIVVPAGTAAVFVELSVPAPTFFIGGTVGNTAGTESFLKSATCGVTNYVTANSIAFPDAHFFITATGTTNMGVNEVTIGKKASIYPNPVQDQLNIKLENGNELEGVQVFNMAGKLVNTRVIDGQVDFSALPKGVYMIQMNTAKGVITQKVIKN